MDPKHVAWCRTTFDMIKDGGSWGVPRSGLMFQRQGDTLMLLGVMPHEDGMPISAAELTDQQDAEYRAIRRHFEAAGIKVFKR